MISFTKDTTDNTTDAFDFILSGVNKDTANLKLPDPYLRDYYKEESDRIIWIKHEINEDTLDVMSRIYYYNKEDKDFPVEERVPIKIFIDTVGGSVSIAWSIMQAIKLSKTPVWTINWSEAMSAGAHILSVGHKRFAMPGSTVLIHSGSCTYQGTVENVESAKKFFDALSKKIDADLISVTKIPKEKLKKRSTGDWYLTADEAVQYGIVDKIITDYAEIF